MKQILSLTFLFLSLLFNAIGQDFRQEFNNLSKIKDTTGQEKILQQWQEKRPNDPELYVAYYNFYVRKSMEEVIELGQQQKGESSFQLKDSSGKVAGYMNDMIGYKE